MSDSCESVRVAVNVRPLVTNELATGCTDCVSVYPSEKQVQIGSHAFTFDYVFGSKCSPSTFIFEECVAPLVDALFHGYNGTVLAYGQTGSGKTYTMGTNYNGDEHNGGVIPGVMEAIFSRVESMKSSAEFLIRVSFIEIFKEEVFDLLCKTGGPGRIPIQIRERINGEIALAGVTEAEVSTKEEMASYLLQGSLSRATGSTNMNHQSSRSHAIFTISMEQKRTNSLVGDGMGDDVLIAKLHLVDLAGSERAKRTGADGKRLQEGIHINKGLLALGNVISALGDEKKRKEGGHVPYRDSKLTRILQDSLGGNSKTVMIACISPADTNAEETLNTLKYANRARNIQNKAIVNRDPVAGQLQKMRSQMEEMEAELRYYRGESNTPAEDIKILKQKISLLQASNMELKGELQKSHLHFELMSQRLTDAQVERDRLLMKIQSVRNGQPLDEVNAETDQDVDLLKGYLTKIQELEGYLTKTGIQNSTGFKREISIDYLDSEDDGCHSRDPFLLDSGIKDVEGDVVVEDVQKELEHSSLQQKLDGELKELDKKLEQKEAEMKRFANTDTSVLKQHFEKKVHELELEKKGLQKEIDALRQNLANICSNSDDSAQKLKEEYLQKLNALESQVAELKKKQDAQAQLLRQKQKSDEAAKRLLDEIQRIKTQKVQLQQKIKQESEQFRLWKASREKEVLQLKKEGRRNEYEMHKLLALNQRQKLVVQRKTEEASMATKRLKEFLDSRKAPRETPGSNRGTQALVKTIEHELELIAREHEVRSQYERQIKERAKMAEEVARLKEETLVAKQKNLSEFPQSMSPGARNSRVFALENMLSTTSSSLVAMASQLSEAEERERSTNGRGRWNHIHSITEAKNIMNFLFDLAASSRCQLYDMEVDCREKDSEIRDLKEKVVHLVGQLENQSAELNRQKTLLVRSFEKQSEEVKGHTEIPVAKSRDGHADLKPKVPCSNGAVFQSLEDMDTSDDDDSPNMTNHEDSDSDWVQTRDRKRRQGRQKTLKTVVIDLESPEGKKEEVFCCSCSKNSSCKTSKCECRASGLDCSANCSCTVSKCSNRKTTTMAIEENDSDLASASHGAALLQAALSEKPNNNTSTRKPLSEIGNNNMATNNKGGPRKKWRTVIQLVPSSSTMNNALPPNNPPPAEEKNDGKSTKEGAETVTLKRAMHSALSVNNRMVESDNSKELSSSSSNAAAALSPKGKENKGGVGGL